MTLHFVCCDRAYCNAPITTEADPTDSPTDVACLPCRAQSRWAECPTCGNQYAGTATRPGQVRDARPVTALIVSAAALGATGLGLITAWAIDQRRR